MVYERHSTVDRLHDISIVLEGGSNDVLLLSFTRYIISHFVVALMAVFLFAVPDSSKLEQILPNLYYNI